MENRSVSESGARPVDRPEMGARRFGRVNWLGLSTLTGREIRRFTNVWSQTLAAPVVTAALFMTVFSLAFAARRGDVEGLPFVHFLAPGILMMTVIQNAFANTSSSILVSKVQGNIVDTLMPPLSPSELLAGYAAGGTARGVFVALGVAAAVFPVIGLGVAHPLWALAFVVAGSAFMAQLGMIAAILAQKFDHLAALTNFVVTPLSFLSGTFYSIEVLPPMMRGVIQVNPVFHLIDGIRFGVLGEADSSPVFGLVFGVALNVALGWLLLRWLRTGYKLKS